MPPADAAPASSVAFYDALWRDTHRLDQHHKCRIHAIERMLEHVPPPPSGGRRILELGCGTGQIAAVLARHGDVTGIDQSPVGIARAQASVPGVFVLGVLPAIPVPDGQFDLCVLSQVLEHFVPEDQTKLLENARRKVRPGGHLLVTTPNRPVSSAMRFAPNELQPIETWLDSDELGRLLARCGWLGVRTRFAFNFLPVAASKHTPLRALRFLVYDVLRLRGVVEELTAQRGTGDCTVVLAVRSERQ
jgi:SAM-dependent methyltransferase